MASIVNSSSQDIIASYVSNIAYNDGVLNLPMTIFIIICSVVSINKLFGDLNPLGRSVELLNKFFGIIIFYTCLIKKSLTPLIPLITTT